LIKPRLNDYREPTRRALRAAMLQGLYKVEMHTVHGSRRGVIYVYDGKITSMTAR
jgi:hypothetical protein